MAKIEKTIQGIPINETSYFVKVFTVNQRGRVNNRVDLPCAGAVFNYNLTATITETQYWTAPEDGWYQFDVHGKSGGSGNSGKGASTTSGKFDIAGGGGGGGSGFSRSRVKLKKGDTVKIYLQDETTVIFDSAADNSFDHTIVITKAGNGGHSYSDGYSHYGGLGGAGGVASGGNVSNINGKTGQAGQRYVGLMYQYAGSADGGAGGAPAVEGGNAGANGRSTWKEEYTNDPSYSNAEEGKKGFVKVYKGVSNAVA